MNEQKSVTKQFNNCIKANSEKLVFNNQAKLAIHRLPFIGERSNKDNPRLSFWSVPKTGGYHGGCVAGKSLALIYLKHLRDKQNHFSGGYLQSIVLDMFDVDSPIENKDPKIDALRGQAVGFFSMIESVLREFSSQMGGLDKLDGQKLLDDANIGLSVDEEAYYASLDGDDED